MTIKEYTNNNKFFEFYILNITKENAFGNKTTVIRRGKKNYYLLKHN